MIHIFRLVFISNLLCSILAAGEARSLRVVCLGDSLTGDRPGKPYLHQYVKWSDLIQIGLESRLGWGQAVVINSGWAGGGSEGAVERLKRDVLDHQPDIVVVLIGGNDCRLKGQETLDQKLAKVQTNLTTIVERLHAAKIKVLLLQYPQPFAVDMSKVWHHLDDANPVIAAVAKASGATTLELEPAFAAARAAGASPESLANAIDGVHLNPGGELVVAKMVLRRLIDLGWAVAPVAP